MIAKKKLCILIVGMCIVAVCEANYYSDYLSSHYNDVAKKISSYVRSNDDRNADTSSCYKELRECWSRTNTDISDDAMSRRIVNMLLSRAKVRQEGSILRRYIIMETSESELQALTKFGVGELKLREIDPILSNAIKTPDSDGLKDYVFMMYTWITMSVNYLVNHKGTVVSIIVLIALGNTLYTIRWDFWNILFASIQVLLSTSFLIAWYKVSQNDRINISEDPNVPIQCLPHKMHWMDKALAWFYHYDCDKHYADLKWRSLHEVRPEDAYEDELIQMLVLSGQFLRWIPHFMTDRLPQILPYIITLLVFGYGTLCFYEFFNLLYGFWKERRKIYSAMKNNILKLLRNLQTEVRATTMAASNILNFPLGKNNTKSGHGDRLSDKNIYYRISCGIGNSVIIKTNAREKSLEKSELESKISSILGKSMEVEDILGRIALEEREQITVAMKRKEDKNELIARCHELRDNGLFVEEDVILIDKIAMWNILGLTNDERFKKEGRIICINGQYWIWDDKTRNWLRSKVVQESVNIKDNVKEEKS